MKLRTKTALIILLVFLLFSILILSAQSLVVIPKFERVNIEKAFNENEQGLKIIDDELKNMSIIVNDYAVWDDTLAYTELANTEYVNRNYTKESLTNLDMSFVGIYDTDGFLFSFNTFADLQEGDLLKEELLKLNVAQGDAINGFITVGDRTYMFASQKISSTDRSVSSQDHFILIRNYSDYLKNQLRDISGATLSIDEFSAMNSEEKQNIESLYTKQSQVGKESVLSEKTVYEMPTKDVIVAYTQLYNINGQAFGVLKSNTDGSIILESRNLVRQTGIFLTILGLTLALIMALFINHSIIKPINQLKTGLNLILAKGNNSELIKDSSIALRHDEIGDLTRDFITVSQDIKDAREESEHINAQLENRVQKRTQELESANKELILYGESFEETSEGIVITDSTGTIIKCNKSLERISGYTQNEIIGQKPRLFKSGRHKRNFYKDLWHSLINEDKWEGELWNKKKDGRIFPIFLMIDAIKNDAGKTTHYVGIISDMTAKKSMEIQLEKMAYYDSLTGLANRALFYEHFQETILRANRYNYKAAILYIDLDGFKLVNDTFGHANGDLLLVEIGNRIKHRIRKSDLVSRLGSDEYMVVLERIKDKKSVLKIANDLLLEIAKDFIISGETISVSGSIGIAIFPDDGDTLEKILIKADSAMYASKSNGKNAYAFAKEDEEQFIVPKIIMINRLKKASENSEFHLVYQPQIKIDSYGTRIFGAEALIRWTDENGQILMPDDFIQIAEETGLIIPIGQWVIEEACKTIAELNKLNKKIHISVNVSIIQFKSKNLIAVIKSAIEENQIDPQYLFIEITESIFAKDESAVISIIKELKSLGVKIVLDDFGTGYSSLSIVSKLPFDILKVDKAFAQNSGLQEEKSLASIIISMAEAMNMESIIEGVETREQVDYFLKKGRAIFQGFYFSKPLGKESFMNFLNDETAYLEMHRKPSI
ncbi:bifunctional diguanylate cyclase/phosphodiesterase [Acetobacterium bakii]|uniref:bifunctional diguanylate cyclase/phosphodiesterase n=1 Tax=Acetobacterium bakii TaxID=52689 RepID=UPI00067FA664|nr:EAL domain-containing protein [Acetobacterium bakii]